MAPSTQSTGDKTIEELIEQQTKDLDLMSRAFANLKKKGGQHSRGTIQSRLQSLETKWNVICDRHEIILSLRGTDSAHLNYFTANFLQDAEDTFHDERGKFLDALSGHKSTQIDDHISTDSANHSMVRSSRRKLPPINLPQFSGKYSEWTTFKDIFSALIGTDTDLVDVEKLHYLKSSLSGEAANIIKHISTTGENYDRAWSRLTSYYDNPRTLIASCFDAFLQIPPAKSESSAALKLIKDGTLEVIETLELLGRPSDGDLICHMTVQRLDARTRRDWELSLGDTSAPIKWKDVEKFLQSRLQALERSEVKTSTIASTPSTATSNQKRNSSFTSKITAHNTTSHKPFQCCFCAGDHYISACEKFRNATVSNRFSFVSEKQLCFNCLGPHKVNSCNNAKRCTICQGRHHTLLHGSTGRAPSSPSVLPQSAVPSTHTLLASSTGSIDKTTTNVQPINAHTINAAPSSSRSILLATATIKVFSDQQQSIIVRALIDPCSEATFITESLTQRLRLSRQSAFIPVSGVGAVSCATVKSRATVHIAPHFESTRTWQCKALILPRLTDFLPSPQIVDPSLSLLCGLQLADPQLSSSVPINMIIGADLYPQLIEDGIRKDSHQQTVAQATGLGWIITGTSPASSLTSQENSRPPLTSLQCIIDQELSSLLERFWSQEEVAARHSLNYTPEELECEQHFISTHTRDSSGKFVVRLPIKSNDLSHLGNSEQASRAMFQRTEARFKRQPQFKAEYERFMSEYVSLGHMVVANPVADSTELSRSFFLPHHGVFKLAGDTPKIRVVFNGSVQLESGSSLNECLHAGPKLQEDIIDILLRWRAHRLVFSADIVKMFRQIHVAQEDQPLQSIVWRSSESLPLQVYHLRTVTYGLVSSPYHALRVLQQLALDEGARFPQAARLLTRNRYVDDILAGADTLAQALELKDELINLLKAGGFPLSKWTSNDSRILADIHPADLNPSPRRTWHDSETFQMLGISWNAQTDCFFFDFNPKKLSEKVTKRTALSLTAQLYDPLGWIAPVTVSFKIFMQTLWHAGLQWDDELPSRLLDKWNTLFSHLDSLRQLSFPRWIRLVRSNSLIELHGFSDASERAYAACLYARIINDNSETSSLLLAAKSKVSPLKQVSLPRLELNGAVLLVRLTKRIQDTLELHHASCHLWSDSTVTLSWIRGHPSSWKTYVANRVSEIQTTLPNAVWHHVKGKSNPADLASRGVTPNELKESSLWTLGPDFLTANTSPWLSETNYEIRDDCPERRNTPCIVSISRPVENDLLTRYSSLQKLLRISTRCLDFINILRARKKDSVIQTMPQVELTPTRLHSTLQFWIQYVQRIYYREEIDRLLKHLTLPGKSTLIRLRPFLDPDEVLRVGGRLRHSLLHPDQMNPIIIPHNSYLTQLLVREAHEKTLHGGTQLTLNYLRQKFWIVRGRQIVKSTVNKCLKCWRQRSQPASQLMGDLPSRRVQRFRPFLHTGVDYAGPIYLRISKGRGTKSYKGYIAVFVCFSTRAVHLEAASGYSTEDFLNVFRRFVARRGICAVLYSDCGTNFVGADKELRTLFEQAKSQSADIARLLANDGTEWRFNPPAAPHFGGLWEAAVKSVKFHLKRIIGETLLTFEELSTLLAHIESCLNSRPLCPLSDDPDDLSALTPGHFLIGEPTLSVPEPSILDLKTSRLSRLQLLRQMQEHFWNRWSSEYLTELHHRSKWRQESDSVKIGQLCLLRSNLQPPCKWPLARITEIFPGSDGLPRVVKVRTASSTFLRPLSKISVLPESSENYSPTIGEGGRNVSEMKSEESTHTYSR